jgi:hypothetical protein
MTFSMTRIGFILAVLAAFGNSQAQGTMAINAGAKAEAVLTNLAPAVYPRLARQAGLSGEVELRIEVRQDGSIASTTVITGHPLLVQAAVDSAEHSTYPCLGCSDPGSAIRITYTFELRQANCADEIASRRQWETPPRLEHAGNTVTISTYGACSDHWPLGPDYAKPHRTRSAKCLWLWNCGSKRVIGIP